MKESLPFVNEFVIKEHFHELLVCGMNWYFLKITGSIYQELYHQSYLLT